ncbi:MAG: hypothetical protein IKB34_05180, partial [Clostridia bacterium]|nr:hypothetical protein [Clostridia bacterium]
PRRGEPFPPAPWHGPLIIHLYRIRYLRIETLVFVKDVLTHLTDLNNQNSHALTLYKAVLLACEERPENDELPWVIGGTETSGAVFNTIGQGE